jgi:hypothetical protein
MTTTHNHDEDATPEGVQTQHAPCCSPTTCASPETQAVYVPMLTTTEQTEGDDHGA